MVIIVGPARRGIPPRPGWEGVFIISCRARWPDNSAKPGSSSGGGGLPIARIDGQPLGDFPGPITKRLRDAYWALHDDPRYRDPVER